MSNQPESLKSKPSAPAEVNLPHPKAEEPPSSPMKLVRPPSRPAPVPVEKAPPAPTIVVEPAPVEVSDGRLRPIPPPSEPTQYRAIGVVRGTYQPSEEQFTRGNMVMHDGSNVEAVLLGRVMSLVRNHLELDKEHVWVVYPRTREREETLHLQIVGVWEPENLTQPGSESEGDSEGDSEDAAEDESDRINDRDEEAEPETLVSSADQQAKSDSDSDLVQYVPSSEVEPDTFSIRGEIVTHEPGSKLISVKIQQVLRKKGEKEPSTKYFKLNLEGDLRGKVLGYFWDLNVKRVGQDLKIIGGTSIVLVMPKKYPKRPMGRRPMGGGRRPGGSGPSGFRMGGDRESRPAVPSRREGEAAPPKPVIKRKESSEVTE